MAVKQPFRTALAWMIKTFGSETPRYCELTGFTDRYGSQLLSNLTKLSQNPSFSPLTSSAGRLFDAVSALLGICPVTTFEAEAAIALEAEITQGINDSYDFELTDTIPGVVNFSKTLSGIISDMLKGVPNGIISAKFHNTLVRVIQTVVLNVRKERGLKDAALSGGVFQNLYLLKKAVHILKSEGFNVYYNIKVPANDGGISPGQAFIAREILKDGG